MLDGIGWWNEPNWPTAQTLARYYLSDVERSRAAMLAYDGSVLPAVSVLSLVVGVNRTRSFPSTATGTARRLGGPAALVPGGHGVYEDHHRVIAGVVCPSLDVGRSPPGRGSPD